jgi:GntR family transcriptional regulator
MLGDEPVSTSTSWFAGELAELGPALLSTERIKEGTGTYVKRVTGRALRYGVEQLSARLATGEGLVLK